MPRRYGLRTTSLVAAASLTAALSGLGCGDGDSPWAEWPTEEWPVSSPEDQGMDADALTDFVDAAAGTGGIDGVTVVRNGYVVADATVSPFPHDGLHDVLSVTKSVMATLIGITIDRELLAGVDVPVVEILADHAPGSVDELKASMTVEDLLTMSTGLDCRDSFRYRWQGMAEMMASDDWVAHVLALPMSEEPGTEFEYCNGSSLLLSAIVSEVTGVTASEFARAELFEPLGISEFEWDATPGGVTIGWSDLALRPSDLARIGLLYARGGEWDGDQLVSREWIDAATTGWIDAQPLAERYGYQWWIDDGVYSMALGYGGQYIFVAPDQRLVVVVVSGLSGDRTGVPEELLNDHVLPAIMSDGALAANAEGAQRLATAISAAAAEPEPVTPVVPDMADAIHGVRYEIRPNDADIGDAFELRFGGDAAELDIEDSGMVVPLEIGLDGRFVTNEVPGARPMALRGSWSGDDTFIIEYHVVGEIDRGTWRVTFDGDGAWGTIRDVDGNTVPINADRVG